MPDLDQVILAAEDLRAVLVSQGGEEVVHTPLDLEVFARPGLCCAVSGSVPLSC